MFVQNLIIKLFQILLTCRKLLYKIRNEIKISK